MNPPPPFHLFHSPPASPYTIHTPDTDSSFDRFSTAYGSDRYSDISSVRTQSLRPHIINRQPSLTQVTSFEDRPVFMRTTTAPAAMEPVANKDYLFFVYNKGGAKWDEEPIIDEIPASEAEIKKKAKKRNALEALQKMGSNRRIQVDRHVKFLNANEPDGSTWEPIYIENTKIKQKGNVMEVKTFEVIYARKQSKHRRNSMSVFPIPPLRHEVGDIKGENKEDKSRREKRKSKDKKAEKAPPRGGITDDPFGETQWFDMSGATSGGNGAGGSTGGSGLPPFIPPEKPIGTLKPRIIQGLNPEADDLHGHPLYGAGGLGLDGHGHGHDDFGHAQRAADEILQNLPDIAGEEDDIIAVETDRRARRPSGREDRNRDRRSGERSRSRSRRRFSMRQDSGSRTRNVRFPDHFRSGVNYPISSNSSVTSGEVGIMFDEVEELSSRTSDDTNSSTGHKIYRPVVAPYRQHRPGPIQTAGPKQYELASNEKVLMPAVSRRRSTRVAEHPQIQRPYEVQVAPYDFEHPRTQPQPLVRRNTSPRHRPTVHQQAPPPPPPADVPPIAVYPQYFEERERQREHENERHVADYMRGSNRERDLRDREDEVAQRERAVRQGEREQSRREEERRELENMVLRDQLENLRLNREFGQRRSVYTHEPRDLHGFRR